MYKTTEIEYKYATVVPATMRNPIPKCLKLRFDIESLNRIEFYMCSQETGGFPPILCPM